MRNSSAGKVFIAGIVLFFGVMAVFSVLHKKAGGTIEAISIDGACKEYADISHRLQCWQHIIQQQLHNNNLDAAFAALDAFIKQNPSELGSCHGLTHQIGQEAFKLFNQNKDFALSPKTSYCGYGFYHGFMEALVHTTNDMRQARGFCKYVGDRLRSQIPDAEYACYHGIGHGVVDGSDPRTYGDPHALIAPGLKLCAAVSSNDIERDRCASGVFNSLAIMYANGEYKLVVDSKDPYGICRAYTDPSFKKPCYEEMNTLVMKLGDFDFQKSARFTQIIPEDLYAKLAVQSLAGYAASAVRGKAYTQYIDDCHALQKRLHIPCIKGFAAGLVEFGVPEKEYVEAISFCASDVLAEEEKNACFARILPYLSSLYSKTKMEQVCSQIAAPYRINCPNE